MDILMPLYPVSAVMITFLPPKSDVNKVHHFETHIIDGYEWLAMCQIIRSSKQRDRKAKANSKSDSAAA
jgi:hypothetical protein